MVWAGSRWHFLFRDTALARAHLPFRHLARHGAGVAASTLFVGVGGTRSVADLLGLLCIVFYGRASLCLGSLRPLGPAAEDLSVGSVVRTTFVFCLLGARLDAGAYDEVVGRDSSGAVCGGQNLSVGIHSGSLFAMVRRRISLSSRDDFGATRIWNLKTTAKAAQTKGKLLPGRPV